MSWFRFVPYPSQKTLFRPRLEWFEDRLLPSVFMVTDLGDAGNGSNLQGDLRYCITHANANTDPINQIVFQPGLTGTIGLTQGGLSITKEIVIDGPGQDLLTISGNGQSGVFSVTQSGSHVNTVFISDLTIADGTGFTVNGKIYGGGIYTTSTDLTLTRVTVAGNVIPKAQEGDGGGIYNAAGSLTLVDTTVVNNQVGGGGLYQRGGGIYNASGNLLLVDSTVADNQVDGGGNGGFGTYCWGGGIYNEGTLTVRGSTIAGNIVAAPGELSGGGIYNALGSTVTISDSAVINNIAVNGGGILSGGDRTSNGQVLVDHSTISGNQGGGIWDYGWLDVADSTIANNTGQPGIYATDFRIEQSTISGNNGDGGVWQLGGPASGVIENSTISGNTGSLVGGILMGNSYAGLGNFLTLDHCTIVNNQGGSAGGILVGTYGSYHGYLILGQTIVAGNDATDPSAGPDVNGPVEISQGSNFIGNGALSSGWSNSDRVGIAAALLDPMLGPLQDNGGPTLTHAPLPGSSLLLGGAGDESPDQRGSLRLGNAPGAVAYNPATAFRVSGPSSGISSQPLAITVTAIDPWGNTASTYSGMVHISSTDSRAGISPDSGLTNGSGTFSTVLYTAGIQSITATDTITASLTGTEPGIVVAPAAASQFQISAPATAVSGTPFDLTVTALDPYGNIATNYQGTVAFTSSDADLGVVLPAVYTFTTGNGGDNGVHTFPAEVTLMTSGDQTLTVTDTASGIAGSATVTVTSPAPSPGGGATGAETPSGNAEPTAQQVFLLDQIFLENGVSSFFTHPGNS
jgi:hypothetical protein